MLPRVPWVIGFFRFFNKMVNDLYRAFLFFTLHVIIYSYTATCPSELTNSIQFNSVYLYNPISQITNLSQSALQSVHIDIPAPKPRIGPGKTPKSHDCLASLYIYITLHYMSFSWCFYPKRLTILLHSYTVDAATGSISGTSVLLKDTSARAGTEPPTPWLKDGPATHWPRHGQTTARGPHPAR